MKYNKWTGRVEFKAKTVKGLEREIERSIKADKEYEKRCKKLNTGRY